MCRLALGYSPAWDGQLGPASRWGSRHLPDGILAALIIARLQTARPDTLLSLRCTNGSYSAHVIHNYRLKRGDRVCIQSGCMLDHRVEG